MTVTMVAAVRRGICFLHQKQRSTVRVTLVIVSVRSQTVFLDTFQRTLVTFPFTVCREKVHQWVLYEVNFHQRRWTSVVVMAATYRLRERIL